MTTSALPRAESAVATSIPVRTYRHAHWLFLVALAGIVAGFWPSFFRPLGAGDLAHSVHGVTATLWVVILATQSWLMSQGRVAWHRRVAWGALLLLPVFITSAFYMVAVMFANPQMPPFLPPLLAFIDLPSVLFFILLVTLALRNLRTPAAHKRFMAATVLLGLPPALTRLYARVLAPHIDFMGALHGSFLTVELILVALIVADRRAGERRLAYPLSLAFFLGVHSLMGPVSASESWRTLMAWYVGLPVFS